MKRTTWPAHIGALLVAGVVAAGCGLDEVTGDPFFDGARTDGVDTGSAFVRPTDCPVDDTPEACEVIDLVNVERAIQGRGPLAYNYELSVAAQLHAEDMSEHGYLSHTSLDRRQFDDRARDAGYDAIPMGENIARGQVSPAQVMDGWMNSPGHRTNILRHESTEIGVGYEPEGRYWVQVFGRR